MSSRASLHVICRRCGNPPKACFCNEVAERVQVKIQLKVNTPKKEN